MLGTFALQVPEKGHIQIMHALEVISVHQVLQLLFRAEQDNTRMKERKMIVSYALKGIHAMNRASKCHESALRGSFAGPTTHRLRPVRWAPTATGRVYETRQSVCCAHLASTARRWGC